MKKFVNKKVLDKRGEKRNKKPQCYKCKGFRNLRNECLDLIKEEVNDKKKEKEKEKQRGKEKGKKVLQAIFECDDENELEEFLVEFYFVANDEEEGIDEELQATLKDMYQNFINADKVNKDLKMMFQSLSMKNKELKIKATRLEKRHKDLTSTNKELVS